MASALGPDRERVRRSLLGGGSYGGLVTLLMALVALTLWLPFVQLSADLGSVGRQAAAEAIALLVPFGLRVALPRVSL